MVIHPEIQKNILTKSFKKTMEMKQIFRLIFVGLNNQTFCQAQAWQPDNRTPLTRTTPSQPSDAPGLFKTLTHSEREVGAGKSRSRADSRRELSIHESTVSMVIGFESLSLLGEVQVLCPDSKVFRTLNSAG